MKLIKMISAMLIIILIVNINSICFAKYSLEITKTAAEIIIKKSN